MKFASMSVYLVLITVRVLQERKCGAGGVVHSQTYVLMLGLQMSAVGLKI